MAWRGSRGIRDRAIPSPRDGRVYRGLYICRKAKRRINAVLNAASNRAKRIGYKVEIKKILSYIATHGGSKPLTPLRGVTPKTSAVEPPPFRAGRRSASGYTLGINHRLILFSWYV